MTKKTPGTDDARAEEGIDTQAEQRAESSTIEKTGQTKNITQKNGMPDDTPQLLFDYMRDVIYGTKNARLDIDRLNKDFRDVGEGLVYFVGLIHEVREFAGALSRGDLTAPQPGRDNELASPLKALHASLRHMTWQSQQVAKGDYKQRIDYMGEFSTAFNIMTEQLDARQRALELEIKISREKTRALEAASSLLSNVTSRISQIIIVFSEVGEEILYTNKSAQEEMAENPMLLEKLRSITPRSAAGAANECEVSTAVGGKDRYYSVQFYALQWERQNAHAFVVEDISAGRARVRELEKRANWDSLTQMHNRHFGMDALQIWLDEKREFILCFMDLDNLKYVDDTFGHMEGDQYIIKAANLIKGTHPNAVACRIGGDEFMLLLPNMTTKKATARLEGICTTFQKEDHQGPKPYICSISYGLVEVKPGDQYSVSALLSIADERMYECKRKNKKTRGTPPPVITVD